MINIKLLLCSNCNVQNVENVKQCVKALTNMSEQAYRI